MQEVKHKKYRISYLGPENSFSYLAANLVKKREDILLSYPTFYDVLDAVAQDKAGLAVVPCENSIEGLVTEVTDYLIFSKNPLYIQKEFSIQIENFVITKKGANYQDITTVYAHPQPYGQCRNNLRQLFPKAKIVLTHSTSKAVSQVKDLKSAALGGRQLHTAGLILSSEPINDAKENKTRFLVMGKEQNSDKNLNKFSIVFEARNKPGGLLLFLEILKANKINIDRLESRPHKTELGRYVFLLDLNGDVDSPSTKDALEKIKANTDYYKFLGAYNRG